MTDPAPSIADLAARLPRGFGLGVATAALQIEGGTAARGRSTWDDFADIPGNIVDGTTPEPTADSFHRWRDDVALLAELGVDHYRFSISWPRIQPGGRGPASTEGLAYYDRLVDALLGAGVRPMATLYHWDTPVELQQRGGWTRRDTAHRLGEYAGLVGTALGDRVDSWITINEPTTVTLNGYGLDLHAPGYGSLYRSLPAAFHQLLGHGLAVQALRGAGVAGRIGVTNVHSPVEPATASPADARAAAMLDYLHNRLFADPILLGEYAPPPPGLRAAVALLGRPRHGDLATIAEPIDFYGLNYYFPSRVGAGPAPAGTPGSPDGDSAPMRRVPFHFAPWPELPTTGFDWPIAPDHLGVALRQQAERCGDRLPPILITEGGASFAEQPGADGVVDDRPRIDYLARHLAVAADVARDPASGVTLEGYTVWSLVDNWEWAAGFTQRFGLVHLDTASGARTPKASYRWLADLIKTRDLHG